MTDESGIKALWDAIPIKERGMTDIPKDIMQLAEAAHKQGLGRTYQAAVESIALAIMDERDKWKPMHDYAVGNLGAVRCAFCSSPKLPQYVCNECGHDGEGDDD